MAQVSLAQSPDAAFTLDRGGRVITISPNADAILSVNAHDLVGRGLFERLHLLDRPILLKACADTLAGQPSISLILRIRREGAPSRDEAADIRELSSAARPAGRRLGQALSP